MLVFFYAFSNEQEKKIEVVERSQPPNQRSKHWPAPAAILLSLLI